MSDLTVILLMLNKCLCDELLIFFRVEREQTVQVKTYFYKKPVPESVQAASAIQHHNSER